VLGLFTKHSKEWL